MNVEIRMTRHLYDEVRADLERPHPFAGERVGVLFAKMGNLAGTSLLLLLYRYHPIADERYIDDPTTGARIDSTAVRGVMQEILDHCQQKEGAFHVHLHEHKGPPGFSRTDRQELPRLIPSFQSVGPSAAHGLLLLSQDHGLAWVWLPEAKEPVRAARVSVVGAPLRVFEAINHEEREVRPAKLSRARFPGTN